MKKLFSHVKPSLICSIAYCLPVFFLFRNDTYSNVWLLYLGNICFAILLLACTIFLKNKKEGLPTIQSIMSLAIKIEIGSILISCLIILLLGFIYKDGNILKHQPANVLGLYYMLPLSTILINFVIGIFGVYIWSITTKTN
ncbi:hypothetical protein [Ferruginibacter albus]|uniref:hypothetical protein n=1 Tax=Ferruginibacter albus TaxID=2875540 RepID=UPI001CC4FB6D|nr:hypothetical protein [Ferruginibacter albus]UAY52857.1 hypothetical protein K9M53_04050 [Ferruginibacter albus]